MKKNDLIPIYTDAGWRKFNEAPIYIAHVVCTKDGKIINKKRIQEIAYSSTYIEYFGLIYAMEYCLRVGQLNIHLMNDNQTMVYQVQGRYRVKTKQLRKLYDTVIDLWGMIEDSGGMVRISWIKRTENIADAYVNECKHGT